VHEPPFIAGVAGGVGTTTIAAALRGRDCGLYRANKPVQVLVCRSTLNSLGCAQRALQYTPAPPVLAIVDDVPNGGLSTNTANRVRMTEGYTSDIIRIPFVTEWRDVETPHHHAADLLVTADQPKGLRAYADAVLDLVDAIVAIADAEDPAPVYAAR
jgi:hypothetical protein